MIKTALAIGRWMPIHLGHKQFLTDLARKFDRLVIGIGSCYENGTPRNCIPAIEREKLLRRIFKSEGLTNVIIVPVEDRPTFEEWFSDVIKLCEKYDVTHFCTGNKEDILNVMKEKDLTLNAEMINPEDKSNFPYHATDVRNAILRGDMELVDSMLPSEIKDMVLSQVAREIRMASEGRGQEFIPGRQTVDLIFIVTQKSTANHYLLIGKRNGEKIDFPGCWGIPGGKILEFESPVDAAVRCFEMEAGIDIRVADNSCEPALVTVESLDGMESLLHFSGIYASEDERINGTRGGGSQCFAVCVEGDVSEISRLLHSRHDMDELKFIDVDSIHSIELAYDQKRMVLDALNKLGIAYDNGEMLCTLDENGVALREGVSRSRAHSEGILHGAAHTYIYKWEEEELYILLQRRSLNKDSFPGCLDSSSAGHIELGSDFLQTAKKELFEELGLEAGEELFRELFEQRIHSENVFHGRAFIDNEINKVYAIEMPVDISTLAFQPSEVSEVVWLSADRILAMLTSGDGELCMDDAEIKRVIEILKEKK